MNGIVFVATGARYIKAAAAAAESARAWSPALGIDLFTDAPAQADGPFDKIHHIDDPHGRSKVDCLPRTRFARSLYLDTDIRIVSDITEMFDLLDRFDVALAHAHARNRPKMLAVWRKRLPDAFPQLNGGVILYKSSQPVLDLLHAWRDAYHTAGFKKDQVTLRELLWESDLRLTVLPPEYNLRYPKYLDVWDAKEAVPRIQHFKEYNPKFGR